MKKKLSIIIVNFNMGEKVLKCISSISNQSEGVEYEIILIDNASTDNSLHLFQEKLYDLEIIKNNQNLGFASACNQGASIANSEIILFLNPDTIIVNRAIDKTFYFMMASSNVDIVGCKFLNIDGSYQSSCRSFPSFFNLMIEAFSIYKIFPKNKIFGKYYMTYMDYNIINEVDVVMGAFMMMEKDTFVALNGFDEEFFMYSEETDLCFRAKKAKYKIFYYPKAHIMHEWGGMLENLSNDLSIEMHRSLMKFCRKHHRKFYYILEKNIVFIGVLLRFIYYKIALRVKRSDSNKKKKVKYNLLLKAYIEGI